MNIILCSGDQIQGQSIVIVEGKSIDMPIDIKIKNWKDLVDQFGLEYTYMGVKSAKQISKQMRIDLEKEKVAPLHYEIRCNTDSEAIALFQLVSDNKNQWVYEYAGTAN